MCVLCQVAGSLKTILRVLGFFGWMVSTPTLETESLSENPAYLKSFLAEYALKLEARGV